MDKFITRKTTSLETPLKTSKDIASKDLSFFSVKRSINTIDDDSCEEEEPILKSLKKDRIYMHKYRSEWENNPDYASWIQLSTLGNTYFKCKICAKDYIGGTAALKKHVF